jgi:hypothetical protein
MNVSEENSASFIRAKVRFLKSGQFEPRGILRNLVISLRRTTPGLLQTVTATFLLPLHLPLTTYVIFPSRRI